MGGIVAELAKRMQHLRSENKQGRTVKLHDDTWRALWYLSVKLSAELGYPMTLDDVIKWLIEQVHSCGKLPT